MAVCLHSSYSLSDIVNSNTVNAAENGFVWDMVPLLPDQTGLTIQGVFHRYTLTKDPNTDSTVHITNKDTESNGYIYHHQDNWNQLPSNTKVDFDPIASSLGSRWGEGEIKVNGDGTLSDVTVLYHYRFDPCYIPLSDPECPNFKDALYQYLLDNGLIDIEPDINDPYYDEWLKLQQEQKAEAEELEAEAEKEKEEQEEKENIETALSIAGLALEIASPLEQQTKIEELVGSLSLDSYTSLELDGGVYEDTVTLDGGKIYDNRRALRSLRQDSKHKDMVTSQYK